MGKRIDLTGQKFGRLVVLEEGTRQGKYIRRWRCKCDCGKIKIIIMGNLTRGYTQSCGCYHKERTRESCRKDLTGQKFNRLTVIAPAYRNKQGQLFWECKCDCGKISKVVGSKLQSGSTKSCGCYNRERIASLKRLPKGEAAFNTLLGAYRASAKERGYNFQISKKLFLKLTQQVCHYCGQIPTTIRQFNHCNGAYIYNGIDRIDNSKGYMEGNVVPCCELCNRWKHAYSQEAFLEQVKRIYEHSITERKTT